MRELTRPTSRLDSTPHGLEVEGLDQRSEVGVIDLARRDGEDARDVARLEFRWAACGPFELGDDQVLDGRDKAGGPQEIRRLAAFELLIENGRSLRMTKSAFRASGPIALNCVRP